MNINFLRQKTAIKTILFLVLGFHVVSLLFNLVMMNILILGSGGREHAFADSITKSPRLNRLFISPGNAGTASLGTNLGVDPINFNGIKSIVLENSIDLIVVGAELPLVNGIVDFFQKDDELKQLMIVGPDRIGAALEGSKDFAKDFMLKHGIPTARYKTFTSGNKEEALAFLESLQPPYVLKVDGLAAGKGVVIPNTIEEARQELSEMLDGKFGQAGNKVVIEEFLKGIELSVFVLSDGNSYLILPEAKDYKRIGEGDSGLNTGGMGAVSPVPFAKGEFMEKVEARIVKPTIEGLQKEGIVFKGFIFIGLMNVDGDPVVIEYNVRMGDPESEVVLPRIQTDLVDLLVATAKGKLDGMQLKIDSRTACTVMLVSGGYPGSYSKGKEITGIPDVSDSKFFHAGTTNREGKLLTDGGRVMAVTSLGRDMSEALKQCYLNADKVQFEGKYCRKDIGFDL